MSILDVVDKVAMIGTKIWLKNIKNFLHSLLLSLCKAEVMKWLYIFILYLYIYIYVIFIYIYEYVYILEVIIDIWILGHGVIEFKYHIFWPRKDTWKKNYQV